MEENNDESEAVTDVQQPNINAFNELLKNIDHLKNVSVDEQQPATISNLRYEVRTWGDYPCINPIYKNKMKI